MALIKVIELVGSSTKIWPDAVEVAVKVASESIRQINGVDVIRQTATVEGGKIAEYRATIHVAFQVEEHGHLVGVV